MDSLFINRSNKSFERVDGTEEKGTVTKIINLKSEDKITQVDDKTSNRVVHEYTEGCVAERVTSYLQELYKWNVGKGEGLPNNEVKVGERQTAKEVIDNKEELKDIINPEDDNTNGDINS